MHLPSKIRKSNKNLKKDNMILDTMGNNLSRACNCSKKSRIRCIGASSLG
jgi:hypothetical protein